MAVRKEGGDRPTDQGAAFIDRMVKDPKNPPKTLLLTGYLGRSSEEGHTRLYLDPELSDYVEIPTAAILHTEDSGEDSPLAGSYVWIARNAEVVHGEAGGTRYRAGFLEGRIVQDHLGGAAGAAGPAGFGPVTIPFWLCGPTRFPPFCPPSIPFWRCPTRFFPLCRSVVLVHCPSQPFCRPSVPRFTCPVSVIFICPSVAIRCPSVFACPPQSVIGCPPQSVIALCPSVAIRCPSVPLQACPQPSALTQCPTFPACPSVVDACPSAPGGCPFDQTIYQGGTLAANPGAMGLGGGGGAEYGMDVTGGYGFGAGYGYGG